MVRGEAGVDGWGQVHAMWQNKKLHGALNPGEGSQCDLHLDRRIWGSPPPSDEAQPVASSDRPQPVAGSRSGPKSILDVEQNLKAHPYVREETVKPHKLEHKAKNPQDHLSPWDLEFYTAIGVKHTLGLTCNKDERTPRICHGCVRFPETAGKS